MQNLCLQYAVLSRTAPERHVNVIINLALTEVGKNIEVKFIISSNAQLILLANCNNLKFAKFLTFLFILSWRYIPIEGLQFLWGLQGTGICCGACLELFDGKACYLCQKGKEKKHTYAIDMASAV